VAWLKRCVGRAISHKLERRKSKKWQVFEPLFMRLQQKASLIWQS